MVGILRMGRGVSSCLFKYWLSDEQINITNFYKPFKKLEIFNTLNILLNVLLNKKTFTNCIVFFADAWL